MGVSLAGFNAEAYKPLDSLDPVPAGWYTVIITESEMKPTKAGDGEYLQLTMQIVEGEFQGRLIWDRLNLINPNQTAVDIANRALAAICRAVGVLTPTDSSELHDRPFQVKVSVRPARDGFDATNEVKGYRALGAAPAAPATPAAPVGAAAAASPATASVPPWRR